MISPVQSHDPWRKFNGTRSIKVGRICSKGRFLASSERVKEWSVERRTGKVRRSKTNVLPRVPRNQVFVDLSAAV